MNNSTNIRRSRIALISTLTVFGALGIFLVFPAHEFDEGMAPSVNPVSIRETESAKRLQNAGQWEEAFGILKLQAKGENPKAKMLLANQMSKGWGTARDLDGALDLLLQAVQFDFPERGQAAYQLGKLYRLSTGENCQDLAFQWFIKSLDWGNGKAHQELAKSYSRGLGTKQDFTKAVEHYHEASALGSASAIVALIALVDGGIAGTPGDRDKAMQVAEEWIPTLEQSAVAGSVFAARSLARLFLENGPIKKDHAQARHWLETASSLGDPVAMHDLVKLAVDNRYDWYANEKLLNLVNTSAKAGYPAAFTLLGRLHLQGKLGLNPEEASNWFTKGVKAGHAGSMEELARLHWTGAIKNADVSKARQIAEQGARLRHSGCIKLLQEINQTSTTKMSQLANKE